MVHVNVFLLNFLCNCVIINTDGVAVICICFANTEKFTPQGVNLNIYFNGDCAKAKLLRKAIDVIIKSK